MGNKELAEVQEVVQLGIKPISFRSYLHSMCRDDTKVSWDSVSTFDLHKISSDYLLSIDVLFLSITHNQGLLQNQNVLKRRLEPKCLSESFLNVTT